MPSGGTEPKDSQKAAAWGLASVTTPTQARASLCWQARCSTCRSKAVPTPRLWARVSTPNRVRGRIDSESRYTTEPRPPTGSASNWATKRWAARTTGRTDLGPSNRWCKPARDPKESPPRRKRGAMGSSCTTGSWCRGAFTPTMLPRPPCQDVSPPRGARAQTAPAIQRQVVGVQPDGVRAVGAHAGEALPTLDGAPGLGRAAAVAGPALDGLLAPAEAIRRVRCARCRAGLGRWHPEGAPIG